MKYLCSVLLFICIQLNAQNISEQLSISELDSIADLYYYEGDFKSALPYAEASLAKAAKNGKDSIYIRSLNNLVVLDLSIGTFAKGIERCREAKSLHIKWKGNQDAAYAEIIHNLATLYWNIGRYEDAEQLYIEAIGIERELIGEEDPDYGLSLVGLGGLYLFLEKYEQAEPLLRQATSIFKEALGEADPYYIATLRELANLYKEMEAYQKAEPLFLESLTQAKKELGVQHPDYAVTLSELGAFYIGMKRYKEAEQKILQSLPLLKKAYGENSPYYIKTTNDLALAYELQEKYSLAESFYLEAIAKYEQVLGKQHSNYMTALNNLADLYCKSGQFEQAKDYYDQAIFANLKTSSILPPISDWANQKYYNKGRLLISLDGLSNLYWQKHKKNTQIANLKLAQEYLDLAMQFSQQIQNGFSKDASKLRMLRGLSDRIAMGLKITLKLDSLSSENHTEQLFYYAEQNKSALLTESLKAEAAKTLGYLPDSLAKKEKDLQKALSNIERALILSKTAEKRDSLEDQLNHVNIEVDQFQAFLKEAHPQYTQLKYAKLQLSIQDIQSKLDEESLFLEYLVLDKNIYLFAIQKNELNLYPLNLTKEKLRSQIKILRGTISDYDQFKESKTKHFERYTQIAYWFYKALLSVALQERKNIKKLIIIADDQLGQVPFEVFLKTEVEEEKNYNQLPYLIKEYEIYYHYAASLWLNQSNRPQAKPQILGLAANYNATTVPENIASSRGAYLNNLRKNLAPLPEARQEVEALAKSFQGSFYFDSLASESNFKANAGQYGIIHLAMHGLLNSRAPILSGLAFTETIDSTEDNFLQTYEISQLSLNAELVVLSACETGYGQFEEGEGLLSLARSFMYAGVPSLLVSLWQVNDQSTSYIMQSFYKNLAKGMTKAAALRQAKLDFLATAEDISAHPAFWSPFILLGQDGLVKLSPHQKTSYLWIWIGLGIIVFGLIFFLFRKKLRKQTIKED